MKNLLFFLLLCMLASCDDPGLESRMGEMERQLAEANEKLKLAEAATSGSPGLIHSVFFWLREDLTEAEKNAFLLGCRSLKSIGSVRNCYIGPPASTEERGVVDKTYSYALIVHFDDEAGEKAYQIDPIHLKFVKEHKDKWTKVMVYDSLPEHGD